MNCVTVHGPFAWKIIFPTLALRNILYFFSWCSFLYRIALFHAYSCFQQILYLTSSKYTKTRRKLTNATVCVCLRRGGRGRRAGTARHLHTALSKMISNEKTSFSAVPIVCLFTRKCIFQSCNFQKTACLHDIQH